MSKQLHLPFNQQSTADSFANFAARLGYGAHNNLASRATYTLDYISHNRQNLDNIYASSWIAAKAVDTIAEDSTKKGIEIKIDDPAQIDAINDEWDRMSIWGGICDTIRWSRLYGGALALLLIEGQDFSTPLRMETIGKGQFRGLLVLDRWMVQPSLSELVQDYGPDFGKPMYYDTFTDSTMALPNTRIHYSRVIRIDGQTVPHYRRMAEMGWGISVIERLYDRLLAFDSTTQGIAQLVYKAHLRTLQMEGYRDIVATGGQPLEGVLKQVEMIRALQTNEGITLLDGTDKFEAHNFSFAGLDDVLLQFGQQLSGSLGIPLTKLFGQAPAGLNSTGESDLENYYSEIHQEQETKLRTGIAKLLDITYRSIFGRGSSEPIAFTFRPLKQMSELDKANIASTITNAVTAAESAGIIDAATAAQELRHSSDVTGVFSFITDELIQELENQPPTPELEAPGEGDDFQQAS